jgi:hypothetical protein
LHANATIFCFWAIKRKNKKGPELRGILVSDKGDIIYDRGEKRYENPSNNKIGSSTVY